MGDQNKQQQTRHARRLYVGGIPQGTQDADLNNWFSMVVAKAMAPHKLEGGPPVVQIYIDQAKCFAFVELSSIELTTACLGLDGMKYEHRGGTTIIKVRRPNDFKEELMPHNLQPLANFNLSSFGMGSAVSDGPGKLFIGGLPYGLDDDQVKELLSAFGILKSFHLVRDPGSITSKGYGFCEYMDLQTTQTAIEGLNDLVIGQKTLTVRIASGNAGAAPSQIMTHMQAAGGAAGIFQPGQPSQRAQQTAYGSGGMGIVLPPAPPSIATQHPTRVRKFSS
jgi:splicing factor U2AF subunit